MNFVAYYDNHHHRIALNYVTASQVHSGEHLEILSKRDELYTKNKGRNRGRWIGNKTRNFTPTNGTWITPPQTEFSEALKVS